MKTIIETATDRLRKRIIDSTNLTPNDVQTNYLSNEEDNHMAVLIAEEAYPTEHPQNYNPNSVTITKENNKFYVYNACAIGTTRIGITIPFSTHNEFEDTFTDVKTLLISHIYEEKTIFTNSKVARFAAMYKYDRPENTISDRLSLTVGEIENLKSEVDERIKRSIQTAEEFS